MGSVPGQGTNPASHVAEGGGKKLTRLFFVCLAMPGKKKSTWNITSSLPSLSTCLLCPRRWNEAASLYQASYPPKREQLAKRWLLKCKGHLIEKLCFKKSQLLQWTDSEAWSLEELKLDAVVGRMPGWGPGSRLTTLQHFSPLSHVACRIWVPRSGIEPMPLAVKVQSPNHWTAGEFPSSTLFFKLKDGSEFGSSSFSLCPAISSSLPGGRNGPERAKSSTKHAPFLWVKGAEPAEMAPVGPQLQTFLKSHVPPPCGTHLDDPCCGSKAGRTGVLEEGSARNQRREKWAGVTAVFKNKTGITWTPGF